MTTQEWIAQAWGVLGVILFILSFQIKSNKALLFAQMGGNTCFALQLILLGGASGCVSLLAMILRNLVITLREKYDWAKKQFWPWFFIGVLVVLLVWKWDGPISLLPFIAAAVSTVCYWTDNARNYRIANLFCACPCWFFYNLYFRGYAGMLNEVITFTSILVSIIRFGWKSLGDNRFDKEEETE